MELHTVDSLILGVREAGKADLEALNVLGPGNASDVSRLRIRHHRIAQLLATGMLIGEVAEYVGVREAQIGQLASTPAMRALIAEYQRQAWAESEQVMARARLAGATGVAELQRRLLDNPEKLQTKELANLTFGLLDRGGVGVVSKHVHLGLSSADIRAIVDGGKSYDVEVLPEDSGPSMGALGPGAAVPSESREDSTSEGGNSVREQSSEDAA